MAPILLRPPPTPQCKEEGQPTNAFRVLTRMAFTHNNTMKVTIMGQNGAGKSSIIKLLSGEYYPESGDVNIRAGNSVAVAKQTMPVECRDMSVEEYFISQFDAVEEVSKKVVPFLINNQLYYELHWRKSISGTVL